MRLLISRMSPSSQCPPRKPMSKIMWSLLGSFLGIYLVGLIGQTLQVDTITQLFLIGSLGATAVLIYGAPMAEFSQPRNLIGGHVLSAFVGVTVAKFIGEGDLLLASAIAVSVSIALMHLTRTLHPPGGATALIAVIGGEAITDLGYYYVISPVLFGSLIMLLVGLLVNNLSSNPKRHYPVYWW